MILLPLEDNKLLIDATAFNKFATCPRSFEYYFVRKREAAGRRGALEAGAIFHKAMELRRLLEGSVDLDKIEFFQEAVIHLCYAGWVNCRTNPGLKEALQVLHPDVNLETYPELDELLSAAYPGHTPDIDDFRTEDHLIRTIRKYNIEYQVEPFTLFKDAKERPVVEVPFSYPLASFQTPLQEAPITVVWTGRIDLPTLWPDGVWSMDLKTGTRDSGFDEWVNNQAQIGYLWALRRHLSGTPHQVNGFIIDKVFWRATTKTGKGTEFTRHKERIEPERIDEWEHNTIAIMEEIVEDAVRGYFPMKSEQHCAGKYGACQYLDVCKLRPSGRGLLLSSDSFYKNVTWSPLRKPNAI